jgi:hypothetical protein
MAAASGDLNRQLLTSVEHYLDGVSRVSQAAERPTAAD